MEYPVVCARCGLMYCPDLAEDEKQHAEEHQKLTAVEAQFGERYLPYRERERIKKEGHDRLNDTTLVLEERLVAYESICRAWFWRSVESAMNSGFVEKHPPFSLYIRMLWIEHAIPSDLQDVVRERYPEPDITPGVIPQGKSYWRPSTKIEEE